MQPLENDIKSVFVSCQLTSDSNQFFQPTCAHSFALLPLTCALLCLSSLQAQTPGQIIDSSSVCRCRMLLLCLFDLLVWTLSLLSAFCCFASQTLHYSLLSELGAQTLIVTFALCWTELLDPLKETLCQIMKNIFPSYC